MKIIPSRRALLLLVGEPGIDRACGVSSEEILHARRSGNVRVGNRPRSDANTRETCSPLLREARMARHSAPDKAVKLLQTLRQEYPESYEAGEAMIALLEMASTGEAPAALVSKKR